MESIIAYLKKRNAIQKTSSEDLEKFLESSRNFYIGFDPTAPSLHLGNLLGIVLAKAFQKFGHTPYILIGSATAKIGDPSGKTSERVPMLPEIIAENTAKITAFFTHIFSDSSAVILNNESWVSSLSAVEFLRDVGRYFRLGPMLAKDSVQTRLDSDQGMSFTEFSYSLIQALDFLHLSSSHNVSLQIGGSDQWGNMTAGIDLNRKKTGNKVHALTFPLLTDAQGKKLGKTVKGATWLDPEYLSPYSFYQELMKTCDQTVISLLKLLTFLPIEQIDDLARSMQEKNYVPNTAQTILATEVTRFVHGEEALKEALEVTKIAQPGRQACLSKEALEKIAKDMPCANLGSIVEKKFSDVALQIGLVKSKSEAVRLVKNGGAYINNERIHNPAYVFSKEDIIGGCFVLVSSGKKKRILIRLEASC